MFSVEHPIYTAPSSPGMVEIAGDEGERHRVWPLNEYQAEGLRVTNWHADGVQKYDRTTGTYVNLLLDDGFELTGFREWYPTAQELEAGPGWVADMASERIRPVLLLVGAIKKMVDHGAVTK